MRIDHIRDLKEFKELYDARPMPSPYDYEWLIKNPNLFCFYDDKLLGFITIQREDVENFKNVLTLSGVSIRKNMPNIITAIITVCKAFNEDMYSYTPLKEASLVLRKAGFKKISDRIYRRIKNG